MSEAAIFIVGVLVLILVAMTLLAVRDPAGFTAFMTSITDFEFSLKGITLRRAVVLGERAEKKAVEREKVEREKVGPSRLRRESVGPPRSRRDIERVLRDIPSPRSILWVDDHPAKNADEIGALRGVGLKIDQVTTNDAAKRALAARTYDLVISDIGRDPPQDLSAGLLMPEVVKVSSAPHTPILFYVGSIEAGTTPEGYPVTDRPSELFEIVKNLLKSDDS
jgi:CheY-like chemotaxis protein